jgi:uncharacterized protein
MGDVIVFDQIDKDGPQTYSGTFAVPPGELDRDEIATVSPVSVTARAEKGELPGEYIVDGSATFTADFNCSRCLDPYPIASTSNFHVRFRPRPASAIGEDTEEEEVEISGAEELDVEFYSEREIPLRELALEQIQLAIPMKPLCDEKCLGLCAQCGVNRNREECHCETSVVDERWGALRGIRDEIAKKKDV